jgi:P-type Cu+ transporter
MNTSDNHLAFYIDGIRCMGCVNQIEKAILPIAGLSEAKVNLQSKTLEANIQDARAVTKLTQEVAKLGFKLVPANSPSAKIVADQSARRSLKELAVAGACAGNIMMFAIPIYAGLEGPLKEAFEYICFFLFLPVLFYSSRSFYIGAWSAVRSRSINIDLPITLALISTTFFSSYSLFTGGGQIYFDSTASFVFLILGTRFLMERSRQKLLTPMRLEDLVGNSQVVIDRGAFKAAVKAEKIVPGDLLNLISNQIVPVDGVCRSQVAMFDSSFVDGESLPRVYFAGAKISSGFRAVGEVQLEATTTVHQSELAKFVEALNRTSLSSAAAVSKGDKLATGLIVFIMLYATLVMASGYIFGWQEMIERGTAILVIACPCALAFANPVTIGTFLKKAAAKKIFIRDGSAFEIAAKIKNVFLDKTGTLTEGQLELQSSTFSEVSDEIKSIVLAMEKVSEHPVAFAFRRAWPLVNFDLPAIENLEEIIGQGVKGIYSGKEYQIVAIEHADGEGDLAVGLFASDVLIGKFFFRDRVRAESRECAQQLRQRGMQLAILSGDRQSRVRSVAETLGILDNNLYAEQTPQKKADVIAEYQNTLMVGDGINDALALGRADLGVAVRGGYAGALNSANVFMGIPGLKPLIEFFALSDQCQRTLRRNFTIALAYNLIGALAATFGFVNPLVAAVAMPLSSVLILASTYWGVKWKS